MMNASDAPSSSRRGEFPCTANSPAIRQQIASAAHAASRGHAIALVAPASSLEVPSFCRQIGLQVTSRGHKGISRNEFRFLRNPSEAEHMLTFPDETVRAVVFTDAVKLSKGIQEGAHCLEMLHAYRLVVYVIPRDPMLLVKSNDWTRDFARTTRMTSFPTWNQRDDDQNKILDLLVMRILPSDTTIDDSARSILKGQTHDGIDAVKRAIDGANSRMRQKHITGEPFIITATHVLGGEDKPRHVRNQRPSTTPPSAA